MAPLLPKLRGQVAEFLNQCSLDRLGMLYLPTCVGLGYGLPGRSLEVFLGSIGSPTSPDSARTHASGVISRSVPRICLGNTLHVYPTSTIAWVGLPSCVTPSLACTTRRSDQPHSPKGARTVLSSVWPALDATTEVPEYQPVIHRLRLSASP